MKKFIILASNGTLDCGVILEESDKWLGREAVELNNREAEERLSLARKCGEGVFEDSQNVININL